MYKLTLIPGDGIGPEIVDAAKNVIAATSVPVNWEIVNAGLEVYEQEGTLIPENVFESLEKNKIALKGPITTPIGKGFQSINVHFRKKYDLYANIRPVKTLPGIKVPFSNIDLVIFRENTEDLYIGIEKMTTPTTAEATKQISEKGSRRIIKAAFEYAKTNNKSKVAVVHKANIMKLTDGLFLACAREVSKEYPQIQL